MFTRWSVCEMKLTPYIRWLIRRDLPEVLDIERASSASPWTEEDFLYYLRKRNVIGMVAEHAEQVVGFMLYELHKTRLNLLHLAVHPGYWRRGIGEAMLTKLLDKLNGERRSRLTLLVAESNLDAQLFFRDMGLRATGVLREHFDDGQDAFSMEYRCRKAVTCEQ